MTEKKIPITRVVIREEVYQADDLVWQTHSIHRDGPSVKATRVRPGAHHPDKAPSEPHTLAEGAAEGMDIILHCGGCGETVGKLMSLFVGTDQASRDIRTLTWKCDRCGSAADNAHAVWYRPSDGGQIFVASWRPGVAEWLHH